MSYLWNGVSVFLGVLAGTAVTILTQLYMQRRAETQKVKNLKFELDFNVQKIAAWLEECGRYRNAVNGDVLHTYFGYFDLGRFVSVTANAMFQSGLLYEKLSREQIANLQVIAAEFSPSGEQYMQNQIASNKQALERCRANGEMHIWVETLKPQAVGNVDFWERKFRAHQATLSQIAGSLPG